MKQLITVLSIILITSSFPQQQITDYSKDNTEISVYTAVSQPTAKTTGVSPYHNTPSWTGTMHRQIGGMAFGDYDRDGDLDLAVGCYYSNSYPPINEYENFILKNNNGTLDTIPEWITADERTTTDIKWGDINGDGLIDLISANGNFSKSTIYFNSPAGLSATPGWISVDNVWTVGLAVCDIDGNGYPDLAFANQGVSPDANRPIQVFFNYNGVLSTTPAWSSSDQMITNSIAFANLNKNNLVTDYRSYVTDGLTSIFLIPKTPVHKIDSVKVDGILTDNYCIDELNGWISFGFVPPIGKLVVIYYKYISKGDMAAVKWSGFESGIYFNNNGVLSTLPGWTNGTTTTQKGAAWADFDLDGYVDLAIGGNGGPSVIYKNNNGSMSNTPVWSSTATNTSAQEVVAADINRDGYPDLAVIHFGNSRAEIFFNNGGALETVPSFTYTTASSGASITFGDINNDGWLDFVVGTARNPIVYFLADPSLVPVELKSFSSVVDGKSVLLNWTTATEKNNSGFNIERRIKGNEIWEDIGFVSGKGTTINQSNYQFRDFPQINGILQYRLKQIDYDGSTNYSPLTELEFSENFSFELAQNYPNPFNPFTNIKFTIPVDGFVEIKLYDVLGNEVKTLMSEIKKQGNYNVMVDAGNLNSGVYIYKLSTKGLTQSRKMVIIK
jgi:hypothetical protein